MSTFGKKSLIWWDYEDHSNESALRFNHTEPNMQLLILERWYPIGTKCSIYRFWSGNNKFIREIIGYDRMNSGGYIIKIINNHKIELINPIRLIISPDDIIKIKRESKLTWIL